MIKLEVIIFMLTWNFREILAQVPERDFIESNLIKSSTELFNVEAKMKQKVANFNALVKICSSNLKASNISKNFTDVLDKYAVRVQEVQTMNDQSVFNFSSKDLTDYDFTQLYITIIFSEIRKLRMTEIALRSNLTTLYEFKEEVQTQYLKNWIILTKTPSKNKLVSFVIREVLKLFSTLTSYSQHMKVHSGNFMKINSHLSSLIVSKILLPVPNTPIDSYLQKLREIEAKLIPAQQHVITTCKIAISKVQICLKTTARSVQSTQFTNYFVSGMGNEFNKISTVNDFPLVLGWPQIPITTPGDCVSRSRSTAATIKENQFQDISGMAQHNKSQIKTKRENMWSTMGLVQSTRKVQATRLEYSDLNNASLKVEEALDRYRLKLDWSLTEVIKLQAALSTWTTPAPTIATTMKPCGTFVPYSSTSESFAPAFSGFRAGVYYDESEVYVGTADFSLYLGLDPCPARLSVVNGKAGAYVSDATKEKYINYDHDYLMAHPQLAWSQVNGLTAWSDPYAIRLIASSYPMAIARYNSSNYTTIGRAHFGKGMVGVWVYKPELNQTVKLGESEKFELIGCRDTTFPTCGTFSPYDRTAMYMKGFPAGIYYDGTVAFIGRKNTTMGAFAARIDGALSRAYFSISSTAGSPQEYSSVNVEFLEKSPKLVWKTTTESTMTSVVNPIKWPEGAYFRGIGRIRFQNHTVIGKIVMNSNNNGFYYINPIDNKLISHPPTSSFEMLACL